MDSLEVLIDRYREAASTHGVATNSGDSEAANAAHDQLVEVARQLRDCGQLVRLEALLSDRDRGVVLWAASHLLDESPAVARPALEALSREDASMLGFVALTTLREWEKQRLRPDSP